MNFLEMISMIIPGLGFLAMGIVGGGGGSDDDDDDDDKDKDDDTDDDDDDKDDVDPNINKKLLAQKRKANEEAKKLRLELKKLKDEKEKNENDTLEKKGEFEKLSEKLKQETASKAEKFKSRMILKELEVEAIALKIRDKDDVRIASLDGVEFDEDTLEVTGAKESIATLFKEKPYLFKSEDEEENEDENEDEEAHEERKGTFKTKIKKFDFEKEPDLNKRFNLPIFGKKKKKGK